jgi:N-acetylneuraminic acid mutarotase
MIIASGVLVGIILSTLVLMSLILFFITDPLYLGLNLSEAQAQLSSLWSSGKSMPEPRTEFSAVLLDNKIYVIGGSGEKGITKTVYVYDPRTDQWATVAPLPEARDHMGASSYDGKLYVVGGFNGNDIPTDQLLIYDPDRDEWQEGKPMPRALGALAAQFINGTLYAVGGVDSSHQVVSTNQAYDPDTDTWTERQPMPTARHHFASAVVDGKLYVIGGRILGNGGPKPVNEALTNINSNEAYDPKQNTWTILSPMPTKRSGLAGAPVNSEIYVFGGESLNGTFNNNERYDVRNNIWTKDSPMPTSRLGLDAVSFDNKIYVFGGKTGPPPDRQLLGATEVFHARNEQNQ